MPCRGKVGRGTESRRRARRRDRIFEEQAREDARTRPPVVIHLGPTPPPPGASARTPGIDPEPPFDAFHRHPFGLVHDLDRLMAEGARNAGRRDFRLDFGKHRGETLDEINVRDRGYIAWIAHSKSFPRPLRERCRRFLDRTSPRRARERERKLARFSRSHGPPARPAPCSSPHTS